jgi:hypothetical protein
MLSFERQIAIVVVDFGESGASSTHAERIAMGYGLSPSQIKLDNAFVRNTFNNL